MSQFCNDTTSSNGMQSSKSTNLSSEDKDEEILQLKRKLKVLKAEVLKVRDSKSNFEKQFLEAKARLDAQDHTLRDNERTIVQLQSENAQLQDQIASLKAKYEKQTSLQTSIGSGSHGPKNTNSIGIGSSIGEMFKLSMRGPDEFKKLQTEYNYLRKQFETVKARILATEEEKDLLRRELKKEIADLRTKLANSDEELGKAVEEAQSFEKLYKSVNQAHTELKEQFTRQEVDLELLKSKYSTLLKERDHYKSSFEEKTKLLEEQSAILQQLENQSRILVEKRNTLEKSLLEKENYIADQESRFQAFPVTRKTLMDTPAQLLLRKDVEGDFVIELETVEERKILLPLQITSVSPNKENTNIFTISYRAKPGKDEQETFESTDAVKVLKSLKKLLENAREKVKTEQFMKSKGESGQKKDKKFFAEIVGFFAS